MDAVADPPRIVVQGSESCPDSARVQALLRETLGDSRAPRRGWTVSFHVDGNTPHAVRAEGDIADDSGQSVAHRVLAGSVGDCDGMARAVGVWASLVLAQALSRARTDALGPDGGSPEGRPSRPEPAASPTAPRLTGPTTSPAGGPDAGAGWLPAPSPPIAPDASAESHLARTYEIGLGTFLMTGNGSNAIMGGSLYVFIEAARGFFLRPSLAAGESLVPLDTVNSNGLWLAARLDACTRVPGNYMRNSGLALDLCGGAEAGLTYYQATDQGSTGQGAPVSATTVPLVAAGPSLDLQGELGNGWSVALRGIGEINVVHVAFADSRLDPALFVGRIELALAWRLR